MWGGRKGKGGRCGVDVDCDPGWKDGAGGFTAVVALVCECVGKADWVERGGGVGLWVGRAVGEGGEGELVADGLALAATCECEGVGWKRHCVLGRWRECNHLMRRYRKSVIGGH